MGVDRIAESKKDREEYKVREFVNLIKPEINKLGCEIDTQCRVPYTNYCDRIDGKNKGVDFSKGKKYYTVDVLIYRKLENDEKVPLVIIEGKIKGHSTHDAITYSEKARAHKSVFPHVQYGFIVLDAVDRKFMPLRYYLHSGFDFEEIFPRDESEADRANRINEFIKKLKNQIDIAKEKYQIIFN